MANVYRVRSTFGGLTGTPYISTQFFELVGASGSAGAQEAATAVQDMWTSLATLIATNATIAVEAVVDELDEQTGELVNSYTTTGAPTQPSATGDQLPPASQGLIRLFTGQIRNGHRVNGRIFVPGPMELDSTGGVPAAGYTTALTNAGAGMLSPATASALCVWHRPVIDDNGVVTRDGEAVAVTSAAGADYWAILRSRRD